MTKARISSTPTMTPKPMAAFAPIDSLFDTTVGVADKVGVGVDLVVVAEIEEDVVVVAEVEEDVVVVAEVEEDVVVVAEIEEDVVDVIFGFWLVCSP
jgi:hypothetical protein